SCQATLAVTIVNPPILNVSTIGTTNASCNGLLNGGASVSVTGGTPSYSYSWVDDATSTQVSTSQNLSGVGAGNYTLTVTDANGCTATTTASITQPGVLTVVTVTTDPSCSNSNDGSIVVNVSGGTAPYTYSMNGGAQQGGNSFSGLSAGIYTIDVVDANGCSAVGNAILVDQYSMSLAVQSQTNVSCSGQN
ncbi:MAG: SprB repeat-containing protein, partial [Flavobacteriales bacterium]|nr:SprB repeat-containing protein [Flavobacteriales bacterium]